LAGRDRAVVALRATRVLRRERDASDGTEPAVIHRRQSEAAAGRVAVTAALAGCGRMNIDEHLWSRRRARNRQRDGRAGRIDEGPGVCAVVAIRAQLARDRGRLVVDEPADESRRVVTIAAIRARGRRNVTGDLPNGTESVVTRAAWDRVTRQHAVIEHPAHVVARRVVAEVAGLRDVAGGWVRIRRRILPDDRYAAGHHARAVVTAGLTAGARYDHLRIVVIRKRRRERRGRVTRIALRGDAGMPCRARIRGSADCDSAVVACGATSGDARVVEGPIRIQLHERGRGVAVATLLRRDDVIRGLAGGDHAVVTRTARAEHFCVVDEARDVEA